MKPKLWGQLDGPNVKFNGRYLTRCDIRRVMDIFEDQTSWRQEVLNERYGRANVRHGDSRRADQMVEDCQAALTGSLAARRRIADYVRGREIACMSAGHPPQYWSASEKDTR